MGNSYVHETVMFMQGPIGQSEDGKYVFRAFKPDPVQYLIAP